MAGGIRNLMIKLGIEVDPAGASQGMARLKGVMEKASAGVGIASGVALAGSLVSAMDLSSSRGKLQAQLGVTSQEAGRIGGVAGKLFSQAYGANMEEVNTAVTSVIQNMDGMGKASNKALESTTARAMTAAQVLGEDVGRVTMSVSQMMRTGLAKNSKEAFDILTKGAQLGANKSQDLLDTFNEYGTQFRKLGIEGPQALGLLSQGLKAGARDSDVVADALKEFSIRAVDGSKNTVIGFDKIGLSSEKMATRISKGGTSANKALGETLDRLRNMKDPVERSRIAVMLFGTQAEDLGDALFALDPSAATKKIKDLGGATDAAGKAMGDTAASRFEAFKRGLQTNVSTAIDGVITKFTSLDKESQASVIQFATITAVAAPAAFAVFKVGSAFLTAGKGVFGFAKGSVGFVSGLVKGSAALGENATAANKAGAALRSAGTGVANFGKSIGSGIASAASWSANVGKATVEVVKNGAATAGAAIKTGLMTVAQNASAVASKVLAIGMRAVGVAVRFATGPVGLIITAIGVLIAIVVTAYKKNETFRNIVNAVWANVKKFIAAAIDGIVTFIKNLIVFFTRTLPTAMSVLWTKVTQTWNGIVRSVKGAIDTVKKHFDFLKNLVTVIVPNAFKTGVAAIGKFWSKVQDAAKNPVKFIVNTVYNGGIAKIWNWVAGKTGLPGLPLISGFAKGGILPGFSRKDDQLIMARSGEGILVPEAVKGLGKGFIHQANTAARNGGPKNVAKALGFAGDPGGLGIPGFAGGGIVGAVTGFFGKAKNFFVEGFMKAARAAMNPIISVAQNTIGGTPFGAMLVGAVKKIVDGALSAFKPYEGEFGGSMAAVNAARSQIGTPYSWGGGGPGGPSYGFAQGANIRGFDCSSLMQYAWFKASGKTIPRTTYTQKPYLKKIQSPQPGAIGQPHPEHTYMASGKGTIIEAPYTGARVREVPMRPTPFWGMPPFSFDNGGVMEPGMHGVNQTRQPEYVFTRKQMQSGFAPNVQVIVHVDPITGKSTYEVLKTYKKQNGGRSLDL